MGVNSMSIGDLAVILGLVLNVAAVAGAWIKWERRMARMEIMLFMLAQRQGIKIPTDKLHEADTHEYPFPS